MIAPDTVILAAVEGPIDEAVLRRLAQHVGTDLRSVFGKQGKPSVLRSLHGYNLAAHRPPLWVVLVDLDRDADCAPLVVSQWLPDPAPYMCFRVAVRAVEAWLLADGEQIARFLSIPVSQIPTDPESLADPKRTLVDLAGRSRRRAIRQDMVPRPASGRAVGPAYASRIIEFVHGDWRPESAMTRADSLRRSILCLNRLLSRL